MSDTDNGSLTGFVFLTYLLTAIWFGLLIVLQVFVSHSLFWLIWDISFAVICLFCAGIELGYQKGKR